MDEFRNCYWCGKKIERKTFFCSEKCRHEYNTTKGTSQEMFDTEYLEFQVQVQVQTEKTNLEAIKALGIAFILFLAGVFGIDPIQRAFGIYGEYRTFIWYSGTITALLVCRIIFLGFKK
jgi:predicted nucleic acid-binding Zn ribbon protein